MSKKPEFCENSQCRSDQIQKAASFGWICLTCGWWML